MGKHNGDTMGEIVMQLLKDFALVATFYFLDCLNFSQEH